MSENRDREPETATRKPYCAPKLRCYGALASVTAGGSGAKAEMGMGMKGMEADRRP